jgi:hypothetical protein
MMPDAPRKRTPRRACLPQLPKPARATAAIPSKEAYSTMSLPRNIPIWQASSHGFRIPRASLLNGVPSPLLAP